MPPITAALVGHAGAGNGRWPVLHVGQLKWGHQQERRKCQRDHHATVCGAEAGGAVLPCSTTASGVSTTP